MVNFQKYFENYLRTTFQNYLSIFTSEINSKSPVILFKRYLSHNKHPYKILEKYLLRCLIQRTFSEQKISRFFPDFSRSNFNYLTPHHNSDLPETL